MTARPVTKIGALRELLTALLHEHERDGAIPTSPRFLFYELVQRGQLSKEKRKGRVRRPDQDLHDALMDIREDGRPRGTGSWTKPVRLMTTPAARASKRARSMRWTTLCSIRGVGRCRSC